jgi:hypothetical protein
LPSTQITPSVHENSEEKLLRIRKIIGIVPKSIPQTIRLQCNRISEELTWKNFKEFTKPKHKISAETKEAKVIKISK